MEPNVSPPTSPRAAPRGTILLGSVLALVVIAALIIVVVLSNSNEATPQDTLTAYATAVLATWHIRLRKDGLGLPDHSYPWAQNSIEGQGKPVLLAV